MGDAHVASPQRIDVSVDALVLMVGAAGSGKSTFAARHFPPEAVISSDRIRAQLGAGESDQRVTDPAFTLIRRLLGERLERGLLTVVDATNVQWIDRAALLQVARLHGRPAVAIVLDLPVDVCLARNTGRQRVVRPNVVKRQVRQLRQAWANFELEGFAGVAILRSDMEVDAASVRMIPSQSGD
jgi:protein phosphatase